MDERFSEEYIQKLAYKYKAGTLTEEERADFEYWYANHDDQVFAHADARHPKQVKARMLKHVLKHVGETKGPKHQPAIRQWWLKAAAILIMAIAIGLYFYPSLILPRKSAIVPQEILPGGNRATLTLAGGQKISLDSSQSGIIIGDKNIKYHDGNSVLAEKGESHRASGTYNLERTTYNSLSTPKGGQYQIILEDRTKVWLNAASTLTYPSQFPGDSRVVNLEGEGFFEIKEDRKRPFKVISKNQEILVLGTSFNLSAYADEIEQKTTLVTGTVQVNTHDQLTNERLKPGQQAINASGKIQVKTVDITAETAWRYGKFIFTGKPFKQVMDELARWYDLEVVYEGDVPAVKFFGGIKRDNKLSAVLHVLEDAGIDFSLQNNRRLLVRTSKNHGNQ